MLGPSCCASERLGRLVAGPDVDELSCLAMKARGNSQFLPHLSSIIVSDGPNSKEIDRNVSLI